jgi:hypothetical protein
MHKHYKKKRGGGGGGGGLLMCILFIIFVMSPFSNMSLLCHVTKIFW